MSSPNSWEVDVPAWNEIRVDYRGQDLKVWMALPSDTRCLLEQPGVNLGQGAATGLKADERPWERSAFELIKRIPLAGRGHFEVERVISYSREFSGRPRAEYVGHIVELPPSVPLSTYDVGHLVVVTDGIHVGTVERVTARRLHLQTDWYSCQVKGLWVYEHHLRAMVPDGDYSRVEEIIPGHIRWPIGTLTRVLNLKTRRYENGIVRSWDDDGLARIYLDSSGRTMAASRLELEDAERKAAGPVPTHVWTRPPRHVPSPPRRAR